MLTSLSAEAPRLSLRAVDNGVGNGCEIACKRCLVRLASRCPRNRHLRLVMVALLLPPVVRVIAPHATWGCCWPPGLLKFDAAMELPPSFLAWKEAEERAADAERARNALHDIGLPVPSELTAEAKRLRSLATSLLHAMAKDFKGG